MCCSWRKKSTLSLGGQGAFRLDLEEARPQTGRVAGHPADQVTGAAFVVLLDLQAQEVSVELSPGVVDDRLARSFPTGIPFVNKPHRYVTTSLSSSVSDVSCDARLAIFYY